MKFLLLYCLLFLVSSSTFGQATIKSFYFERDQVVPTIYSQNQLVLFKEKLTNNDLQIIKVYAYTDSVGSAKYNDSLAKKRLEFVVNAIGIQNQSEIPKVAYGLNRVYDAQSFLNWRRVDIYYQLNKTIEVDSVKTDTTIPELSPIEVEPVDTAKNEILSSLDNAIPYILNIEFFEGTANLDQKSNDEIGELVDFLKANENVSIIIRGHVCCGKNMRMSKKRAKTVYKAIVDLGISKKRLSYKGMSNNEPLVFPELSDADRQRNRRVDVQFIGM